MATSAGVLERFTILRDADLDAWRASVSAYLSPHRSRPRGRHVSLRTVAAAAPLGPITLVYADHRGAEIDVELTEQPDYYDVNLAWAGHNRITCDGEEIAVGTDTGAIISPQMKVGMRLGDHYRQVHVRIERTALERHLESLIDRPVVAPITFRSRMDLTTPAGRSWSQAVRLLVADLDTAGGLASISTGSNPWLAFLMTGLLTAQPHSYSDLLLERQSRAHRPAPVKAAVDLIEREPESDLSLDRLALVAGVSPRSLQRHFKDYVGVTPRDYIREIRLARAHADLSTAQPGDGRTVADIAYAWGFGHVPRFAASYRRRYGVAPAETLRHTGS